MKSLFRTIFSALFFGAVSLSAQETDILEKWIAFHKNISTLEASFSQTRSMRTVATALGNSGTIWINYRSKAFRWQAGPASSPKMIAVKNGSTLTVANVMKKEYEKISATRGEAGAAIDFAVSGIPKSMADLNQKFTIKSVKKSGSDYKATLTPKDRRLGITEAVFEIDGDKFYLKGLDLTFRDGSKVKTDFSRQKFNAGLDASLFDLDLSGYSAK